MACKPEIARRNGKLGGRPAGSKNKATLFKEEVREKYIQKVLQVAENTLFSSQLHLAVGQTFLYKIEKEVIIGPRGGKQVKAKPPKLVTDPVEIEMFLMGEIDGSNDITDPEDTYYFLTTKEPNPQAIRDMLDRALDKASQPLKGEGLNGAIEVNVNQITFKKYAPEKKLGSKSRSK